MKHISNRFLQTFFLIAVICAVYWLGFLQGRGKAEILNESIASQQAVVESVPEVSESSDEEAGIIQYCSSLENSTKPDSWSNADQDGCFEDFVAMKLKERNQKYKFLMSLTENDWNKYELGSLADFKSDLSGFNLKQADDYRKMYCNEEHHPLAYLTGSSLWQVLASCEADILINEIGYLDGMYGDISHYTGPMESWSSMSDTASST